MDSTLVGLPAPGGRPGSSQDFPILQAPALHAVYPVAAQTTNVEGTITKLAPFSPGSPTADAGFAGISVTLTSPSNKALTTVTDASGHYAFDNLQGDFVMNLCHLKVDAGGGNSRVTGVQVGSSPSTKQEDVNLGTSSGLTLVDGQALAPAGAPASGLLQPHIEIKVLKGDTQTAVPLLAPGGVGTYGQYRIGFSGPAGSYRVVLYEGSIAVDSDYVGASTGSQLRDVTLRDLKGIANPATTILSRALSGHLTHVGVLSGVGPLVETPAVGITVELTPDTSVAGSSASAFTLTAVSDANGKYAFDHVPAFSRYRITFSKGSVVLGSVGTRLGGDPSLTIVDARVGDFAHEVILEGTYTGSAPGLLKVKEGTTSILPGQLNGRNVNPGTYAVTLHSLSEPGAVTLVKEGPAAVAIGTGGAAITIKGQTHDLRGKVADPVIEVAVPDIAGP